MPTQQDFLPFATGGGANVVTQAQWAGLAALTQGFQSGIASSAQLNKAWRQSSIIASVIAQMIVAQTNQPVVDDGTTATILANLNNAIKTLAIAADVALTSITTTGGATVLTAAQAQSSFISVSGVLTSNAVLTLPSAVQNWVILNATTGPFTVTCQTAGGSGVPVTQGQVSTVTADGTNIKYALYDVGTRLQGDSSGAAASTLYVDRAVADIGGYYQDVGGVANAYVVAMVPATTAYFNGLSLRFRTTRANSAGCTLDAGAGPVQLLREDRQPLQPSDLASGSLVLVTYDTASGAAAFLVNRSVASELGALAKENIGQGLEDDGAGNLRVKLADSSMRRTAAGIQGNEPITTVGVAQNVGASNHFANYQTSAPVTFTLAKGSTLWNGFCFAVKAQNGTATLTPNATDTINGSPAGMSYLIQQGSSAMFVMDDSGTNWTIMYASGGEGYLDTLNATGYVLYSGGSWLVNTAAGPVTLPLPANPQKGYNLTFTDASGTWAANFLTLQRNGKNIQGLAQDFTANVSDVQFTIWYNGSEWRLV